MYYVLNIFLKGGEGKTEASLFKIGPQINHNSVLTLNWRKGSIIFQIDFDGFLRFRGSMLGGKIDLGVSWRPLGASWRRLKASWRPLGAS